MKYHKSEQGLTVLKKVNLNYNLIFLMENEDRGW